MKTAQELSGAELRQIANGFQRDAIVAVCAMQAATSIDAIIDHAEMAGSCFDAADRFGLIALRAGA